MSLKKSAITLASMSLLASISIAATPQANEMEQVTIYGAGFGDSVSQALPQTEIISSTQIHSSGLNNVGMILEKLGNIYTVQDLGANMNASPDIRGYGATSSNNVVILIDGIKISQNEQLPARIWNIPVEAIDHIEIVRGSATVLYGEGATSGVINIITNKQKENFGNVSIGVGSYGTVTSDVFMSKSTDKTKLSVFGKTSNSNGYRQQSESQLKSGGFQVDHELDDKTAIGFRYGTERNQANLPGYLTLVKFSQNPTQPQNDLSALYNNQVVNATINTNTASGYIKHRDGDYEYILDASRRTASTDYMNTSWYENDKYESKQDSINARAKISNFAIPNNTVIAGVSNTSASRDQTNNSLPINTTSLFFTGRATQTGDAVFVQDDWNITPKDRITLGARRENFKQGTSATGIDWSGAGTYGSLQTNQTGKSVLNAYEIQYSRGESSTSSKYVKLAQSYRLPNVDDLSRSVNYAGDLFLKPQINKDFEVGTKYNYGSNRGYLKYFRSEISDEILFDKTSSNWVGYNVNAPKTLHQGIEFADTYSYSNKLSLSTSVSVVEAIFQSDTVGAMTGVNGKRISGTPNYILGIGADYRIDAKNAINWKTRLVGNQYPQGDNQNSYELGAYSISDFGYRWNDKKWAIFANVNNVFDKKYGSSVLADQSNRASANYPYVMYPNWGRNYTLTLRYSFD